MISIIVPVYNAEKYLEKCISSIVNQTCKDIEIVCVDDGSTDKSGSICEEWGKKDFRIRVYHKINGGLMSAWQYGVARAKGEYIGFVDSDDWVDADMYETMVSCAKREKCDLICVALQCDYTDGSIEKESTNMKERLYSKEEIRTIIFPKLLTSKNIHTRFISPNRVTKLFRRELLLKIIDDCFTDVSIGEDLVTTFNYLQICDSIYFIENYYPYHYRINVDSMIQKFDIKKYEQIQKLRTCLLTSNTKYNNYDFTAQINADFIDLYLKTIESQILHSNTKDAKRDILKIWTEPIIKQISLQVDYNLLSLKDRLYLFLLNRKMMGTLIFLRKLKR